MAVPTAPKNAKLLSSPKLLSKMAPVSSMVKRSPKGVLSKQATADATKIAANILNRLSGQAEESKKTQQSESEESKNNASKTMKALHVPWIDSNNAEKLALSPNINTEVVRLPNTSKTQPSVLQTIKNPNGVINKSPSVFLRDAAQDENSVNYCECGSVCEGANTACLTCSQKIKTPVEYSGYLYIKKHETKLKRYWYSLNNKELYCMN